jgi:hypothetical protein
MMMRSRMDIFRGSNVMRGAIATDGLTDSESFVACLDSALMMNFMNSMSDGISAIVMQNFLAESVSSGSSDHGRQRVHSPPRMAYTFGKKLT